MLQILYIQNLGNCRLNSVDTRVILYHPRVATIHGKAKLCKVQRAYPGFSVLIVPSLNQFKQVPEYRISRLAACSLDITGHFYRLRLRFFQELKQYINPLKMILDGYGR